MRERVGTSSVEERLGEAARPNTRRQELEAGILRERVDLLVPRGPAEPAACEADPLASLFGVDRNAPEAEEVIAFVRRWARPRSSPRGCGTRQLLPIVPFSLNGEPSGSTTIPFGDPIDATEWVSGALLVRLHTVDSWPSTTATVTVTLQGLSITAEQPDVVFTGPNVATATITSSPTAPQLVVANFVPPVPDRVRLAVSYTQGSSAGTVAFSLSVDAIWRSQ